VRQVRAFRFAQLLVMFRVLVFLFVFFFRLTGFLFRVQPAFLRANFFSVGFLGVLFVKRFFFFLSFLLFVELRSAGERVRIRTRLCLFVLCFHQPRGKRREFLFT
jgi:hypothetical protein